MWHGCEEDERVEASFVCSIEDGKADEEADESEHGHDLVTGSGEAEGVVDYIGHGSSGHDIDDCGLWRS